MKKHCTFVLAPFGAWLKVQCKQKGGATAVNTLGRLERLLLSGDITEEEYKKRKALYVETILELYVKGILTEQEMKEKLNQWLHFIGKPPLFQGRFFYFKKFLINFQKILKKGVDNIPRRVYAIDS